MIIPTSVVKFSASSTFWDLLESVWSEKKLEAFDFCPENVTRVRIAKDSAFSSSCQDVKLQQEVAVCQLFDCKYVCFNLMSSKDSQHSAEAPRRSAFDVLMNSATEKVLPVKISPAGRSGGLKATERLYNDLLEYLGHLKVGWSRDCVETIGKRFVSSLRDTLWYLDGQHSKFAERGLALPIRLSRFDGYNDWRAKKAKQPQLSQDNLSIHFPIPFFLLG